MKNLQANTGWTSGKIARTKYMDKSRINVSWKSKTIGNFKLGPILWILIDRKFLIKLTLKILVKWGPGSHQQRTKIFLISEIWKLTDGQNFRLYMANNQQRLRQNEQKSNRLNTDLSKARTILLETDPIFQRSKKRPLTIGQVRAATTLIQFP